MADELRLLIEKLVYGGDGLAHADGNTVFVPYVLPGEEVRAATKSKRKKLVWAELLEVTSASKDREKARCAHSRTHGRTVWLSQPGTVGGAQRDAARDRILFAGEFGDCADR